MHIQNNYSLKHKQNPDFKSVVVKDINPGTLYRVNSEYPLRRFEGTQLKCKLLRPLSKGRLKTVWENIRTGEIWTYTISAKQRSGKLAFLDTVH